MTIDFQASSVFQRNYEADTRIIVNCGSSRSSKTYSIVQLLIVRALESKTKISIIRKESTTIRATVLQDFTNIMQDAGLWDAVGEFNKVLMEYTFHNGSVIEFIGASDSAKLRGAKRDIAFIDESTELGYESVKQIMMRTTQQLIFSYNPSVNRTHWLYSKIIDAREDVTYIHSTYKDNPFLEEEIVKEIESLQFTDPEAWRIFGLGELGVSASTIFPLAKPYTELPDDVYFLSYGLDWGYNDPTAIVKTYMSRDGKRLYFEEVAYASGMNNEEIAVILKDRLQIKEVVYADSAEPKSIDYLKRQHRLNVKPTKKGRDSILAGIDTLKRYQLFYKGENLSREFTSYRWKEDINGDPTNVPEDKNNHAIDALRYSVFNVVGKRSFRVV